MSILKSIVRARRVSRINIKGESLESQIIYRKSLQLKTVKENMNQFLHCVWNEDIQNVCLIGELVNERKMERS
jgi:hypothetical protein